MYPIKNRNKSGNNIKQKKQDKIVNTIDRYIPLIKEILPLAIGLFFVLILSLSLL